MRNASFSSIFFYKTNETKSSHHQYCSFRIFIVVLSDGHFVRTKSKYKKNDNDKLLCTCKFVLTPISWPTREQTRFENSIECFWRCSNGNFTLRSKGKSQKCRQTTVNENEKTIIVHNISPSTKRNEMKISSPVDHNNHNFAFNTKPNRNSERNHTNLKSFNIEYYIWKWAEKCNNVPFFILFVSRWKCTKTKNTRKKHSHRL